MSNIGVAFDMLEIGKVAPIRFNRISGHTTFHAKIDFSHMARYVLDWHRQMSPKGSIYAGVVSRESARIACTYKALNDADVWACEIQNNYLQSHTTEK